MINIKSEFIDLLESVYDSDEYEILENTDENNLIIKTDIGIDFIKYLNIELDELNIIDFIKLDIGEYLLIINFKYIDINDAINEKYKFWHKEFIKNNQASENDA